MATIKDVAARAGVSLGTVSNVLSGLPSVSPDLRRRVERAIRDLGYRPNQIARSLKTKQTRTLGLVVSDITNPFFSEMARGAETAALQAGYLVTAFNTDDRPDLEQSVFEMLLPRGFDGLLTVVALTRASHPHVEKLIAAGVPVVCLDRKVPDLRADAVVVDNVSGVRHCIQHLIDSGHGRIAFLGGKSGMYIAQERLSGYLDAMQAAGLAPLVRHGDFREESGYALAHELFSGAVRPTALFGGNLRMTIGALRALHDLGCDPPQHAAVATFDHFSWLDAFHPRLTAVVQPAHEMGAAGVRLLIDRIEGREKGEPLTITLPTTLRLEESTLRYGRAR